jgi:hypothetical protein
MEAWQNFEDVKEQLFCNQACGLHPTERVSHI